MSKYRSILVVLIITILVISITPASFASAKTKTKKMITYDDIIKRGNTVYCKAIFGNGEPSRIMKVTLRNNKVVKKKTLFFRYCFNWSYSLKGKFLYIIENDDMGGQYLRRINVKTGKTKALTPKFNNWVNKYAIKGKKIYYSSSGYKEVGNKTVQIKRKKVMKLNGKNKKKTNCKIKMYRKKTNNKKYKLVYKYKNNGDVKTYLKTPKGTYYIYG